jgi:hypothetical protein
VVNPALELGVIVSGFAHYSRGVRTLTPRSQVEVSQRENKNTSFFKKEAPKYLFAVKTKVSPSISFSFVLLFSRSFDFDLQIFFRSGSCGWLQTTLMKSPSG